MQITILLGVVASFVQIAGYFIYSRKINIGRIKPNTASWSIWASGAILESSSYILITGDWVKNLLPIACALSALVLFIYCLFKGHFSKLSRLEWFLVATYFLAIFVWWYQSVFYAHLLLVFTAIIAYLPIISNVWSDPMVEDATPWYIWTVAYSLFTLLVVLRWEKWIDIVYPLVSVFLSVFVAVLAMDRRVPGTIRFRSA